MIPAGIQRKITRKGENFVIKQLRLFYFFVLKIPKKPLTSTQKSSKLLDKIRQKTTQQGG